MPDPQATSQPPDNPDATRISSPPESPTQSSLSPQERTSAGETRPPAPISTVVDIGSQLGPYKLVDKLGEGGMGAVYKARHTKLGKFVAMKILPQHVMSRPDALARFEREMLAVGSLHHPNVVQAHDAGEFNGVHYLSMEYVEGQDLQQLVKTKGPMKVVNACKAIRQAAQGLAAAHKLGLVHRDIKPSNLFVTKETGQIKILDMGLALLSQEEVPAALTSTGQCFGTPDYMAPEQWNDAHTCDARADLYSLGCTLFFLLVGHPPYHSDTHRTAANKMKGHVIDPIPDLITARLGATSGATGGSVEPPVSLKNTGERSPLPLAHDEPVARDPTRTDAGVRPASDIPDGLDAIYRKLMAKAPEDRFASANELADALAPFTRQSSPHAPREESRTKNDTPKRPGTNVAVGSLEGAPAPAIVTRRVTATSGEAPIDSLTSTWTPDNVPFASHPSDTVPPRGPNRKRLIAAGGAAALVLMLGVIIITITNRDGTKTKIEVPGDSKVEISRSEIENRKSAIKNSSWHGWPADAPKPAIAPFNAEQAAKHQEAWAEFLKVPAEYTNSIGMKFRLIPPGEFMMGSTAVEIEDALKQIDPSDMHATACIQSEAPRHKVILTQPIYLGVNEVTQTEYEKVMGTNPSHFAPTGDGKVAGMDTTRHPVEMVSWNDAAEFCEKLSQQEKFKPFYFRANETVTPLDGTGYRLPTEAEWEFSCRAGTTTKYWIGDKDEDLVRAGWFGTNSGGRTHAEGELKPNPFGMFEVHGNMWEWVEDIWEPTYFRQFVGVVATDPKCSSEGSPHRVLRSGSFQYGSVHVRSSARFGYGVAHREIHEGGFGLRVVLLVDAVRESLKVTGPAMPKPVATTPSAPASDSAKLPTKFTNRLDMEFVLVGKGTAWLGGGNGQQGEKKVEMAEDFYLGRYEVTQAEWEQMTGLTPSFFSRTGGGQNAVKDISDADLKRFPVENVSWDDAQLFLERLNKQEPSAGWVYRLPKEDEWEYACRLGPLSDKLDSAFDFYFDKPTNQLLPNQANVAPEPGKGLQRTCKVGSYQPNRLGLYDMLGNVHEWCDDEEKSEDGTSLRVRRGGHWFHDSVYGRAANRFANPSSIQYYHLGLRVARVRVGPAKSKPVATTPSAPAGWHGWPADAPPPAIAPFDAERAKQHQKAWAKYLGVNVEYSNSIGMKFVLIPPGEFMMGQTANRIADTTKPNDLEYWEAFAKVNSPMHQVVLARPFFLGIHEVTQAMYERITGGNPANFSSTGRGGDAVAGQNTGMHPVELLSWNDAALFCGKLSDREKRESFFVWTDDTVTFRDDTGYRFPADAEWEFACRAGTTTKFWCGDTTEELLTAGWFDENSRNRTHAVGELLANPFGLSDLCGNVFEWVLDAANSNSSSETVALLPRGTSSVNTWRLVRGGGFGTRAGGCASAIRASVEGTYRHHQFLGFRVALSVDAVRKSLNVNGPALPKAANSAATPAPVIPVRNQ